MLYQLHELQKITLTPLSTLASFSQSLFSNPLSVFSYFPQSNKVAAGCELMTRLLQSYPKPAFGLDQVTIDGQLVPVVQETVLSKPFCDLVHFQRQLVAGSPHSQDPVVLVVAPLSGHHATLLRDTVRTLLQDHDVYITDWTDAKLVPVSEGPWGLEDYVKYVIDFMDYLGPNGFHVVSVCQPTVPVLCATALLAARKSPNQPKSVVMFGGPIDARQTPTKVNKFAEEHTLAWFERQVIHRVPMKYPGFSRQVYPGFLQYAGFVWMNIDRHVESHKSFFKQLVQGDGESAEAHRRFYDEYNAVLDLPAEFYLDTLRIVFHEFSLPKGTLHMLGEHVNPAAMTQSALMTIEGELDDISGLGQTRAAHDLCTNIPQERRQHLEVKGVGHYGIFSGRRWRETIYPQVKTFIHQFHQG